MNEAQIQLGTSLYSMTSDYVSQKRDLRGCVESLRHMGFQGIEIVAAQMVPEYPFPSDRWIDQFQQILADNCMEPVCYSAYIDYGLRPQRDLTHDEIVQFTINDLLIAKKAGFPLVRTQHAISPKIMEEMIPWCEKLGVKLAVEMHHPHHPHLPVWDRYLELFHGKGKGVLGVVPDFSIFQRKPHKLIVQRLTRSGFDPERLSRVIELHQTHAPMAEAQAICATQQEREYTQMIYEKFLPTPVEDLDILIPVSFYVHGKFYYLENGEHDECIPFEEILPRIQKLGYQGFIAAEYEGHHFDMSIDVDEQMARYAQIFHHYIQ